MYITRLNYERKLDMKVVDKIIKKQSDNFGEEGITVAFLGDSVTQGCFEVYKKEDGSIETFFEKMNSYEMSFYKILSVLYPSVPVNIINAGISGDRSTGGAKRVERDVIKHQPDLTIVCYGLNDCSDGSDSIKTYTDALTEIFDKLISSGTEVIFMTPNMMNTRVSVHTKEFIDIAESSARLQTSGIFDKHIDAAKEVCREKNIPVCDCYAIWKQLAKCGVDTTELLSNRINHPSRDMYKMFGYELIKTMLFN